LLLGVVPLLAACPDGEKPKDDERLPMTGGAMNAPPSAGTCDGRVPDPDAPFSSVAGSGSVTQDKWTVALPAVVSGYATRVGGLALRDNNEELRIYLSTSPNACGRVRNGVVRSGEPLLVIEAATVANTKFEARTYARIGVHVTGVREGLPPGPCNGSWPLDGIGTTPKGTLVITAIDNQHVAGRYYVLPAAEGADAGAADAAEPVLVVEFDVPFCGSTVRRTPQQCCVP
jgi:hypothetical protein